MNYVYCFVEDGHVVSPQDWVLEDIREQFITSGDFDPKAFSAALEAAGIETPSLVRAAVCSFCRQAMGRAIRCLKQSTSKSKKKLAKTAEESEMSVRSCTFAAGAFIPF
ncbi:hypothetical protein H70357_08695 [Paenibacillus sp. FSL H7-0357]|uniref:hypothetical protein n=1 Tax=Paenibacillus sp. FSL H7-0357 TaxID=1536774 RepID=UPI0004F5E1C8|nr:hypothetical protein [Paenibacillus sp. FSL H7-0357]AIQ16728.1 hypothetical protein H70357_08695 [Paenibacillus sp. FSL H7-0357]